MKLTLAFEFDIDPEEFERFLARLPITSSHDDSLPATLIREAGAVWQYEFAIANLMVGVGHCSGCTDPRSEGTHQAGTVEHLRKVLDG